MEYWNYNTKNCIKWRGGNCDVQHTKEKKNKDNKEDNKELDYNNSPRRFRPLGKEIGKAWCKNLTRAKSASLTRPVPDLLFVARTWIRKNTDCFVVYYSRTWLHSFACWQKCLLSGPAQRGRGWGPRNETSSLWRFESSLYSSPLFVFYFWSNYDGPRIKVSMIDEMANCPDLQTSAGKSCNHRSRKRF